VVQQLIAIIDDDSNFRQGLRRLLRAHGIETVLYPSGEAFLEALPSCPPACVMVDLNLPGQDGIGILRCLAAADAKIPTIAMTGFDRSGLREQCLAAGASAFLTKPIGSTEFERALSAAIDVHPTGDA